MHDTRLKEYDLRGKEDSVHLRPQGGDRFRGGHTRADGGWLHRRRRQGQRRRRRRRRESQGVKEVGWPPLKWLR